MFQNPIRNTLFQPLATYTATNNLGSPAFTLNQLVINDGAVTIVGSSLVFRANSAGDGPQFLQNSASNVTLSTGLVLSNTTQFAGSGAGTVTVSGNIAGAGGLILNGASYALLLSGVNTFTGGTTISNGVLRALGPSSVTGLVTVVTGGTFDIFTNRYNTTVNVIIAGTGAAGQLGALVNTGATSADSYINNLTLANNAAVGNVTNACKLNINGQINGGGYTLTVTNGVAGVTDIRAVNALSNLASIVVNSGTLRFEASQSWAGTVNVNNATLDTVNNITNAMALFMNGGTITVYNSSGSWTGSVNLTNTVTINVVTYTNFFGGVFSGSGNLTVTGAISGIVAITNNNTYTGLTTLNGGVLRVGASSLSTSNLLINNGVLELAGGNLTRSLGVGTNQVTITGVSGFGAVGAARTVNLGNAGALIKWGTNTFNPSILILNAASSTNQLTFANALDLSGTDRAINVLATLNHDRRATISAGITNTTGTAGLIKGGPGILELSAVNTYNGSTVVTGGILRLNNLAALPGGNLTLSNGVLELAVGNFTRSLGTNVNQVQLFGAAGFGAYGGNRTVNLFGNGTTLVWGVDLLVTSLVLNEADANGSLGRLTLANGLDLNGTNRTINVNYGSAVGWATIAGIVTNTTGVAGLIKAGGGTLTVLGDNLRYNGTNIITGGTLQLGDYLTRNGYLPGAIISNNATLLLASVTDQMIAHNIYGSGSVTKNGIANVTLTGSNVFTGTINVNAGTLTLDYSASASPAGVGTALTLGGGTLYLKGSASSTNSPIFRAGTINNGASAIILDSSAGGMVNLMITSIVSRATGGVVDFTLPSSGSVTITNPNTFGILGGYATVGRSDWATVTNNTLMAYTGYTTVTDGNNITDGSNTNVRAIGNVSITGATTINTLSTTNDGTAATVTLGGNTLRMGTVGGILVPTGAGALTIGTNAADGFLTAGMNPNTAGELVFLNHSANPLTVNAGLITNGTGNLTVTLGGSGAVVLAGTNAYTGDTYINAGTLVFSNTSSSINGTIRVNNGTLVVNAPTTVYGLDVGRDLNSGRGVAIITTNVLVANTFLRLGVTDGYNNAGAIFQTGGAVVVTNQNIYIGDAYPSYGYYNITGGVLSNRAGPIIVANRGYGVLDIAGGVVGPCGSTIYAGNERGAIGLINVSAGTLNAGTGANRIYLCNTAYGGSLGVITVSGSGVINAATNDFAKGLDLMATAGNTGIVNLNAGGKIIANRIYASSTGGLSVFNFNGGTLTVADGTTQSGNFMTGLTAAFVGPGGVIIDNGTNNATISQALLAPTGLGVTNISLASNGGGYIGSPLVVITGGSGTGATAYAAINFNTGQVTNIVITSAGSGYQAGDQLTVTLYGGGFTNPATIASISLGDNPATGGLTKYGSGTLMLSNANTYGGLTTVATGMLTIANGNALGATTVGTIVSNRAAVTVIGGITVLEPIVLIGDGVTAYNGALISQSGNNLWGGTIAVSNVSSRISVRSGSSLIVTNGVIGNTTLAFDVSGILTITNTPIVVPSQAVYFYGAGGSNIIYTTGNNFSSGYIQYSNRVVLGVANALPSTVTIGMGRDATGSAGYGFLDLNGNNQTIGNLLDAGTNRLGVITSSSAATLTVNQSANNSFGSSIAGAITLVKGGSATLTLNGNNTHTGGTVINSGVL